MHQSYRMIAKTLQALEPVLAQELIALGAEEVEEGRRMVSFRGDRALLYRANYQLRTALRVLLPLASFRARTPDELYEALRRLDWRQWMRPTDTFAFDAVVYSDTFTHSRYVGYRAKDALVDYFMEQEGTRPGVRLDNPDLRFHIHIAQEEVTLALDSSGESLHKRGWRAAQTEAPMSEVLAAGILRLAGWEGQCDFIDPMCGSGTLLIEAALIARGIAPGSYGRSFAFQRWHDYDAELFRQIQEEAKAQQRPFDHHIYGSDVAISAVQIARHNVRLAGLEDVIHVEHRALEDCPTPAEPALLVTNPPYGERLRLREGDALYSMIGERLKHNYPGCTAWIITDKAEHFAKIGLRPSRARRRSSTERWARSAARRASSVGSVVRVPRGTALVGSAASTGRGPAAPLTVSVGSAASTGISPAAPLMGSVGSAASTGTSPAAPLMMVSAESAASTATSPAAPLMGSAESAASTGISPAVPLMGSVASAASTGTSPAAPLMMANAGSAASTGTSPAAPLTVSVGSAASTGTRPPAPKASCGPMTASATATKQGASVSEASAPRVCSTSRQTRRTRARHLSLPAASAVVLRPLDPD